MEKKVAVVLEWQVSEAASFMQSQATHIDGTRWRESRQEVWLSRGAKGLKESVSEGYGFVMTSDRFGAMEQPARCFRRYSQIQSTVLLEENGFS